MIKFFIDQLLAQLLARLLFYLIFGQKPEEILDAFVIGGLALPSIIIVMLLTSGATRLYSSLIDRYHLRRFTQNRRARYRLFRHWTKTGVVSEKHFEDQARKVIK